MKKTIIIGFYLSVCCSLTACGNSKDIAEYDIDSVLSNEVTYGAFFNGLKFDERCVFFISGDSE